MTYIRKVDANQKQIVMELRARFYSVRQTHIIGKGFPDIVIGKNGHNLFVEIKVPGERLTPDEREFFDTWNGTAIIGTSAEEIHPTFCDLYGNE